MENYVIASPDREFGMEVEEENEAMTVPGENGGGPEAVLLGDDVAARLENWRREQQEETQATINNSVMELSKSLKGVVDVLTETIQEIKSSRASTASQAGSGSHPGGAGSITPMQGTPAAAESEMRWTVPCASAKLWPEKPSYGDKKGTHPVIFLEELDRFLRRVRVPSTQQLEVALECLTGTACHWADMYRGSWERYEDFKGAFLRNFWSRSAQNQVRRDISSGRWDPRAEPSMVAHLAKHVSRARRLTEPVPERLLVEDLVNHFPENIRQLWYMSEKTTIAELAEVLRKLESDRRLEPGPSPPLQNATLREERPTRPPLPRREEGRRMRPYPRPNTRWERSNAGQPTHTSGPNRQNGGTGNPPRANGTANTTPTANASGNGPARR